MKKIFCGMIILCSIVLIVNIGLLAGCGLESVAGITSGLPASTGGQNANKPLLDSGPILPCPFPYCK